MNITKLGHCCMVIEIDGLRILTDPGAYSTLQTEIRNIDVVLITHEHPDHLHMESLKVVLAKNPQAVVITNQSVGKILSVEKISFSIVSDGQKSMVKNIALEGFGTEHAVIYPEVPGVENTGYFIADKFFYPGDALTDPRRPIDVLALPVAGPWLKISEAIDYAKKLKPTRAFPVHDGMLKFFTPYHNLPQKFLGDVGIAFQILEIGQETKF